MGSSCRKQESEIRRAPGKANPKRSTAASPPLGARSMQLRLQTQRTRREGRWKRPSQSWKMLCHLKKCWTPRDENAVERQRSSGEAKRTVVFNYETLETQVDTRKREPCRRVKTEPTENVEKCVTIAELAAEAHCTRSGNRALLHQSPQSPKDWSSSLRRRGNRKKENEKYKKTKHHDWCHY